MPSPPGPAGAGGFSRKGDDRAGVPAAIQHLAPLPQAVLLIREIVAFHDPALFPAFGLPATLPAG